MFYDDNEATSKTYSYSPNHKLVACRARWGLTSRQFVTMHCRHNSESHLQLLYWLICLEYMRRSYSHGIPGRSGTSFTETQMMTTSTYYLFSFSSSTSGTVGTAGIFCFVCMPPPFLKSREIVQCKMTFDASARCAGGRGEWPFRSIYFIFEYQIVVYSNHVFCLMVGILVEPVPKILSGMFFVSQSVIISDILWS